MCSQKREDTNRPGAGGSGEASRKRQVRADQDGAERRAYRAQRCSWSGKALVPAVVLCPPEVLMSTVEEVASARARQLLLDLLRMPILCRRSCYLSTVRYATLLGAEVW